VLVLVDKAGPYFYLGGGTCLSRCYYNHRYSDDLDFFIMEGLDFIESVQGFPGQLESNGYMVSTYGFSPQFARFEVSAPGRYPGIQLKLDFIKPSVGTHLGGIQGSPLFSRVDNPGNILAEKLSFIYKKTPKDIADIWIICRNKRFHWEEIITAAAKKRVMTPLFIAKMVEQFVAEELGKVKWAAPVRIEDFERDREIMIKNITTRDVNQLAPPQAF
jgi:hypothetical protein